MLHSEPESETGLILSQLMNVDVNISPLVAEVLYDFEPNESDEIGLIAGQTIVILEKGSFTTIYKIYLKKDESFGYFTHPITLELLGFNYGGHRKCYTGWRKKHKFRTH